MGTTICIYLPRHQGDALETATPLGRAIASPAGGETILVVDAARSPRPGRKLLFITGYAENAAVGDGFLDPGMALMTKPFTMEALASMVADMMKAR